MVAVDLETDSSPEAVRKAARASILALGWQLVTEANHSLEARTPLSLRSWGGRLGVRITPTTDGSRLRVEAESGSQLIDWGKSEETLEEFVAALSRELDGRP